MRTKREELEAELVVAKDRLEATTLQFNVQVAVVEDIKAEIAELKGVGYEG